MWRLRAGLFGSCCRMVRLPIPATALSGGSEWSTGDGGRFSGAAGNHHSGQRVKHHDWPRRHGQIATRGGPRRFESGSLPDHLYERHRSGSIGENTLYRNAIVRRARTKAPGLNGAGLVASEACRASNVNVAEELVNMIPEFNAPMKLTKRYRRPSDAAKLTQL